MKPIIQSEAAECGLASLAMVADAHGLRVGLPELPLPEDFPKNIYITFDVDGLDSSIMPATGTPSPGGINWREAQYMLERCVAGRRVVGLDVVELAPIEGLHHADFTAAKLTHLIMGLAHDANQKEAQS